MSKQFTANYGLLQTTTPYTNVLITVENTQNSTLMPNGTFEVDTYDQCTAYIGLLPTLEQPTVDTYANGKGNVLVPNTYVVSDTITMQSKGLYSENYS